MDKEQAREIVEAHEIEALMGNEEEVGMLKEQNAPLYEAYLALLELADNELNP
jgi:hypothetical protein